MAYNFKYLFTPIKIGHTTIRNRIVSSGHTTAYGKDGYVTDRQVYYHSYKAKGGCGLVITFGSSSVHPNSPSSAWGLIKNHDDSIIPYFQKISDAVHQYGGTIVCQITHMGRRAVSFDEFRPMQAPSEEPEDTHRETPHVLDKDEIKGIVTAFADAAVRLKKGGYDGCELSAAHGHLIDQFWSFRTNHRTDEYGNGSLDNRMRFGMEVIDAVREAVGRDFIIGIRITGDEFLDGGLNHDEMKEIAARLNATRKLDYFNIIGGTAENLWGQSMAVPSMNFPLGPYVYLAAGIKEVVDVPVIATGRIVDPVQADQILEAGQADLVIMNRAMIADQEMPKKAMEGRLEDIRQCMGANEGCIGRLYQGKPMICVQNPVTGREQELGEIVPAAKRKKVVVVGGGPGGMEAARMATLRGHDVVLFEKEPELGGQVLVLSKAPGRADWATSTRWLALQVQKLGVDIRLGVEATADLVEKENPDVVIVATGSVPRMPQIPGIDQKHVHGVNEVLLGKVQIGEKVVVADNDHHMRGPSVSEFLADEGKHVELINREYTVGEFIDPTMKIHLYDRLFQKGVVLKPHTLLKEIRQDTVLVQHVHSLEEYEIEADSVVVAYGGHAVDSVYYDLKARGKVAELHLVGDAMAARRMHDALLEATRAARSI